MPPEDDGEPKLPVVSPAPARIAAALIDFLLTTVVVGMITTAWSTTTHSGSVTRIHPTAGAVAVALALRALYDIVGIGRFGTTPGKTALRLRVIAADGGPAGWRRAIVRYVVSDLGWLLTAVAPDSWTTVTRWAWLVGTVVVYLPIAIDPLARGLHDRAAGTVVVRLPARS